MASLKYLKVRMKKNTHTAQAMPEYNSLKHDKHATIL